MSETTKITSAHALANKPRLASIPPMLASVRDYLQEALLPSLRTLFEKIDDRFFELAEKAQIDAEQKIYFNAKKEIRSNRRVIETRFLATINELFHLVPEAEGNDLKNETEKRIDGISIDTPMFSVLTAFDGIVDKNHKKLQATLEKTTKHINKLLPDYTLDQYNSPLSVYKVAQSFLWACESLTIEPEERIIVLNLFDNCVLSDFDKILTKISNLLLEGEISILANTKQTLSDSNHFNTLKTNNAAKSAPQKNDKDIIKKQEKDYQENKNNLLHSLFVLQKSCLVEISDKDVQYVADLVKSEAHKLDIECNSSLGNELQQSMTLIRMLSSFMLSECASSDLQKWINQLYIPLIKAALIDMMVFSSAGHAVRRLLNEIVKAATEVKAGSSEENDLFRRYIEQVIDRIVEEFDRDLSIFPELLVYFKSITDDERKRQTIISARLGNKEVSISRSEKAQAKVDKTIAIISKGKQAPLQIMDFLNSSWRLVLTLAYLTEGDKSAVWLNAVQTAEALVDSVLPVHKTNAHLRLPELLNSIATGLASVGFTPAEIGQFFVELETLHLQHYQSVRARAEKRLTDKPTVGVFEIIPDKVEDTLLESIPTNELLESAFLQTITSPLKAEEVDRVEDKHAHAVQCVSELKAEMWLEFYPEEDQKKRVKIAVILYPSQKFIFVDRDGKKILEKTVDEVVDAIEMGILKLLDADSLFGKALSLKK